MFAKTVQYWAKLERNARFLTILQIASKKFPDAQHVLPADKTAFKGI